jgi:uncharacterized protein (TIGR02117 family)
LKSKLTYRSFILIFFFLLSSCSKPEYSSKQEVKNIQIFVLDNGLHTNIAVPVKTEIILWDTFLLFNELGGNGVEFSYLSFGWGDRDFYINTPSWKELNLSIAFNALFKKTPAVMKVDGFPALRESKNIVAVNISVKNYRNLSEFIIKSFKTDKNNKPLKVAPGYKHYDAFYEAHGKYHFFRTSNTWTADALKLMNMPAPKLTLTSGPLMQTLRRYIKKENAASEKS